MHDHSGHTSTMPYPSIDDRDDKPRKPEMYGGVYGASIGARQGKDRANVGEVPGRGAAQAGGMAGRTRHQGEPGKKANMRRRPTWDQALDDLARR